MGYADEECDICSLQHTDLKKILCPIITHRKRQPLIVRLKPTISQMTLVTASLVFRRFLYQIPSSAITCNSAVLPEKYHDGALHSSSERSSKSAFVIIPITMIYHHTTLIVDSLVLYKLTVQSISSTQTSFGNTIKEKVNCDK